MAAKKNLALAKLRAGGTICGPMMIYGSPDLAEQVAHLGFDFVWLDMQHGENDEATLKNQVARFRGLDTVPLPRVKWNEPGTIGRTLDMGAMGVIVPMIETPEEAAAAVQAIYYPPQGRRSGGGIRLGFLAADEMDYLLNGNSELLSVVMIESEAAVGRVREIMKVPGIDVVLIGPGDLLVDVKSRGHGAELHEKLTLEVVAASKATGTAAGYVCVDHAMAKKRIDQGFRFIPYGVDHCIVMDGMKEMLTNIKKWTKT